MKKLLAILTVVLFLTPLTAEENLFQGKVFYQTKTLAIYEGSPTIHADLVGRCSFTDTGIFRFEKSSVPGTPPQKSYQVIEYNISKSGLFVFIKINGNKYWLQNPLPGVYSFIGNTDLGKGLYYDGYPYFFFIDANIAKDVEWGSPSEEFHW
jgi:hypothetical protein